MAKARQTIKTTTRRRRRKTGGDSGYEVCRVCGGSGRQKTPKRKK